MKKLVMLCGLFLILFASVTHSGVMEYVKAVAGAETMWAGIATVVLLYVFKKTPNENIQAAVGGVAYRLGVVSTLGLSKFKFSAPLWNNIIEPWCVDLIDNTVGTFTAKFIEGLRSDDTNA